MKIGVIYTDDEMKDLLEEMGYDLTNDRGNFDSGILAEIAAMSEGFKWNDGQGN